MIDPNGEGVWDVIKGIGKGAANWATSTVQGMADMATKMTPLGAAQTASFIADVATEGVREYASGVAEGVKESVQETIETIRTDETGEATAAIITEGVLDIAAAVVASKGTGALSKTAKGTEIVGRAMSKAELAATKSTGLVRGGRQGTHFASDAVNNTAKRAQQRLALPATPEVKVTMEVPRGRFSSPTKVKPANNQPGGGMERKATGKIPVVIKNIKEYKK